MYLGTNKKKSQDLSHSHSLWCLSFCMYLWTNLNKCLYYMSIYFLKLEFFLDICNAFLSNPFPLPFPFDSSTTLPKTFPYQLDVPFVLENPVNLLSSAWIWMTTKYTGVWVVAFHVPHPQRTLTLTTNSQQLPIAPQLWVGLPIWDSIWLDLVEAFR